VNGGLPFALYCPGRRTVVVTDQNSGLFGSFPECLASRRRLALALQHFEAGFARRTSVGCVNLLRPSEEQSFRRLPGAGDVLTLPSRSLHRHELIEGSVFKPGIVDTSVRAP
jgi:hypothetical protein